MATYEPPTENLPIFDPVVFLSGDEPLTYNIAVKKFLKYPNAQGEETLQAINVNGIAEFNSTAEFNNTATFDSDIIIRDPNTNQTGEIFQSGSSTNIRANNGGYVYLWTGGVPTTTFQPTLTQFDTDIVLRDPSTNQTGEIFQDQTSTNIRANNNGYIYLWTGGNITTTLQPTLAQFDTNVTIRDPVSSNQIYALPNSSAGSFNPVVQAGDETIVASGTQNTETLTLTTSSTTTNGLRITPSSSTLGYGGTSSTPTTRVVCDISNVSIAPSLKYTDNTIQNSAFTGAGALAGTYTNSDITIDSNGKITAISNGTSGGTNKVITQSYLGNYPSSGFAGLSFYPPAGAIKYDIVMFGTGGLAGPLTASNSTTLNIGGAGGGGQVVKITNVPIIPSLVSTVPFYMTTNSTLTYGGTGTAIAYGGNLLMEAKDGNNGTSTTGGIATSGSGYLNSALGNFVIVQGSAGQNGYTSSVFTSGLPVGGGNFFGGVIGYPQYSGSTTAYQYAQGQRNSALTGNTFGYPPISASPIQYGGVIITWYLE